jgi:hypothetical protein
MLMKKTAKAPQPVARRRAVRGREPQRPVQIDFSHIAYLAGLDPTRMDAGFIDEVVFWALLLANADRRVGKARGGWLRFAPPDPPMKKPARRAVVEGLAEAWHEARRNEARNDQDRRRRNRETGYAGHSRHGKSTRGPLVRLVCEVYCIAGWQPPSADVIAEDLKSFRRGQRKK